MNQVGLNKLAGVSNAEELRRALEVLCLPFGNIKHIQIIDEKEIREYLCFIELDSPELQSRMIDKLGGMTFGESILFRVPKAQLTRQRPTIITP